MKYTFMYLDPVAFLSFLLEFVRRGPWGTEPVFPKRTSRTWWSEGRTDEEEYVKGKGSDEPP